jgi:TRAP-type C4-dicarboxylate transport system permease large subunit
MELGLITPPVGLNLFVINSTPRRAAATILKAPSLLDVCMVVAIVVPVRVPGILTCRTLVVVR